MTHQIPKEVYARLKEIADLKWNTAPELVKYLSELEVEKETKKTRTQAQNSALHLFFTHLATELNNAGFTIQKTLTVDIDWDTESVKKYLWLPFMKSMYDIESTTKLDKQEQITKVHETLMRELGEKKGIEYVPFPSQEKKEVSAIEAMHNATEYPENDLGEDKF